MVLLAATMSSCVPWTVRPIEQEGSAAFDAGRYVESIWDSKVVTAPGLMRGEGKVARMEEGALLVEGADGTRVAVLTGPVIRGTALRDALPFIQFSQFVNQLEFARVGNALNERAARVARTAVGAGDVVGCLARYAGAAVRKRDLVEVTPVTLEIVRGSR